jgi:hypothetical protein
MTLLLTGCSSKSIPTPTITITNTPVAIATSTSAPVPTIAPKPDYVTDENSVETDSGIVFVKDGKAMTYDPKTGVIKEIKNMSTEIVFNNTNDASKIVLAIHVAEFADQNKLHEDVTPGNTESDFGYNMAVNQASATDNGSGSILEIVGIPIELVKVKSPLEPSSLNVIGVAMLKVYGNQRPVPLGVGFFNSSGKFFSIYSEQLQFSPDSFKHNATHVPLAGVSWVEFQQTVISNILVIDPLYAVDPATRADYQEGLGKYDPEGVSPEVVAERQRLIPLQALQAEYGYAYLRSDNRENQTGFLYAGYEAAYLADGHSNFILIDTRSRLRIVIVTP